MDLLVLPSVNLPRAREQFGRVIIEAMACEVPVVGSTSGNIPHLIGQTGGGATFREGDPAYLAAVLEDLIVNPKRRMELGTIGAACVGALHAKGGGREALRILGDPRLPRDRRVETRLSDK